MAEKKKEDLTKRPAPAAIANRQFKVVESPGTWGAIFEEKDFKAGPDTLVVPMGDSEQELAVRVHEYAHLELDKEYPKLRKAAESFFEAGGDDGWWQASMDVVVNNFALALNLPVIKRLVVGELPESCKNTPMGAAAVMRSWDTDRPLDWKSYVEKEKVQALSNIRSQLVAQGQDAAKNRTLDTEKVAMLAMLLQRLFSQEKPGDTKGKHGEGRARDAQQQAQQQLEITQLLMANAPYLQEQPRRGLENWLKSWIMQPLEGHGGGWNTLEHEGRNVLPYLGINTGNKWGKMSIKRATLTRRVFRRDGFKRRVNFIGAFKRVNRALLPASDGRAWELKRKHIGGAVLVDCSGSMSISMSDLEKLLEDTPLAKVALYSGHTDSGVLHIVSEDNRYADALPKEMGGGNIIDGPALRWLAQQREPRVWISDAAVTGCGDSSSNHLTVEAFTLQLAKNIRRYQNIGLYLDELKKRKAMDW